VIGAEAAEQAHRELFVSADLKLQDASRDVGSPGRDCY
jgi:hypothetical protein